MAHGFLAMPSTVQALGQWISGWRSFFPLLLVNPAFHAGGTAEVFLAIDPDLPFADQDIAHGLHIAGGGCHLVKTERDFHNASTTSSMRTSSFRKKRSSFLYKRKMLRVNEKAVCSS